jgi:hypothetical protein
MPSGSQRLPACTRPQQQHRRRQQQQPCAARFLPVALQSSAPTARRRQLDSGAEGGIGILAPEAASETRRSAAEPVPLVLGEETSRVVTGESPGLEVWVDVDGTFAGGGYAVLRGKQSAGSCRRVKRLNERA